MVNTLAVCPFQVLIVAAVLVAGCHSRDDLDGRRAEIPGTQRATRSVEIPLDGRSIAYDIYDNRASATVHSNNSLVIDGGSADFAKYCEGAYRSKWHLGAEHEGIRVALVNGLAGEIYLPLDGDPGGAAKNSDGSLNIRLRMQAAHEKQLVTIFLNERKLGDVPMPTTEMKDYSIRAPRDTLINGENKLRFYFRHTGNIGGHKTAAAIERIAVGGHASLAVAPFVAAPVALDGQRLDALRVGVASRLSFFITLPRRSPQLVVFPAGQAEVSVRVAGASRGSSELVWSGVATESWSPVTIDLDRFAGEVVRLDLVSEGAVDWGRPLITIPTSKQPNWTPRPVDHVIVWTVAALRADRLLAPSGGTPNYARFADKSVRFSSASTASPMPGPAHASLLTGTRTAAGVIADSTTTLAERFSSAGFTTTLVSGNGFVHDEAGYAAGFDHYHNPMRRRRPHTAAVLWQHARKRLAANLAGRNFIYLATVEPHLPYTPTSTSISAEWQREPTRIVPAKTASLSDDVRAQRQRLTALEQAFVRALYAAELRDADRAFGQMLADVREMGIVDKTLIVLVGDHGEELFERGNFGHGATLFGETVNVPLVMSAPGLDSALIDDVNVELVDLYPTLLEMVGVAPNPDIHGRSLVPIAKGWRPPLPHPAFVQLLGVGRCVTVGRHKLVVPVRGPHSLYDIVADPGEQRNLMGTRPLITRHLRNIFGLAIAYESAWSNRRWGSPNNVGSAFAADHGM